MTATNWSEILSRVAPQRLVDLDDLIPGATCSGRQGTTLAPVVDVAPSKTLWEAVPDGPSYIGIRMKAPLAAPDRAAIRLAAMAMERSVVPIILSRFDASGFERFGFRVERLPNDEADAEAAEDELRKFWDLAIIIDGQDLDMLE